MAAYMVVGPTKRNPSFNNSLDSAADSVVIAGMSRVDLGAARFFVGRWAQIVSDRDLPWSQSVSVARALEIVAWIFALFRTMLALRIRRWTSRAVNLATTCGSNPAKASRKASRFFRIVSHESPAWKPSRQSFS